MEHALNPQRVRARKPKRAAIGSAAERTRELLHDLKGDVTGARSGIARPAQGADVKELPWGCRSGGRELAEMKG
jgi:hypothetical protein